MRAQILLTLIIRECNSITLERMISGEMAACSVRDENKRMLISIAITLLTRVAREKR